MEYLGLLVRIVLLLEFNHIHLAHRICHRLNGRMFKYYQYKPQNIRYFWPEKRGEFQNYGILWNGMELWQRLYVYFINLLESSERWPLKTQKVN